MTKISKYHTDEYELLHSAKSIVGNTAECIQFQNTTNLCERYIKWMEYFIEKDDTDLGCLSKALNDANKKLIDVVSKEDYIASRVEIDVLNAFVQPLFG